MKRNSKNKSDGMFLSADYEEKEIEYAWSEYMSALLRLFKAFHSLLTSNEWFIYSNFSHSECKKIELKLSFYNDKIFFQTTKRALISNQSTAKRWKKNCLVSIP